MRITSPVDQGKLNLYGLEFFTLYWAADESVTELELWVDGQAYCSLCGGGTSGSMSVDSWMNPPFQDRCWHVLSLKAIVDTSWVYSEPIIIYDSGYPSQSRCIDASDCQKTSAGLPVDVATGKMWADQGDLFIDGPIPLDFVRRYNHKLRSTNGTFGYGWTHSYNMTVSVGTGAANFKDWTGRQILFPQSLSGSYGMNKIHQMSFSSITGGYRVTTKDGTQYNFNTAGKLTSIVDRNGNTVTLTYSGNYLSTVSDPFGRTLTLGYNGSYKITSLTDGTRTVTYTYDGSTNLATAVDATSKTWTYGYDTGHRLLSITDPLSHVAEAFTYNTSTDKVLTFQQDSGNSYLSFNYYSTTQTRVTNSLGVMTTYAISQYDDVATAISGPGCDSCGSGTEESYLRDAYFNKTQIMDGNGNITKQTFDDWGDVLTRTEAYGTALERTTTYTYNSIYHFVETITEDSVDTGGNDRVEIFSYDSNGNLLTHSISGYSNGTAFTRTTTFTYDSSRGRVLTEDGPRTDVSDVTTYTYYADDDSTMSLRGRLHTVENALGHTITINGYTISGKPTVTLDQNGVERDDSYDNLDRLTSTTLKSAGPSGEDLTTTYTINDVGLTTQATLPNGNYFTYGYDTVNRLLSITDQTGNKTIYAYNTEGRKTREELQDASSTVTKFTNFSYDSYNRLQYAYFNATVPPNIGSIYFEYGYDGAGNQKSIKDPSGHLTCFEFDALNRKTKTHQYLGTAPSACLGTCTSPGCVDLLTQYGYDTQDHLISVTDPAGYVTTYDIDDAGEALQEVSVDSGTTSYTYDAAGNMNSKTDANGITETRSYDALNRLTGLSYPDTSNNVVFSYDSTGMSNGIGKRTGMNDPAGTSVFSYDKRGNIVAETRTPSGYSSFQIGYSYDKNGNLSELVYPSGRTVAFSYDNEDEVSAVYAIVSGVSSTIASSLSYYPFGPRASLTFGNSIVDARTYDSRYRIGNWTTGSLISKTYTWQDDDNITGITDNLNAANNRAFAYDAVHRLTTANGPWGSGSYSYDANGNRLTKIEGVISTGYTYNTGTNRIATATGSEPATYSYDSNGNITNDTTHTYQFSQRNRLATVDTGTTATYSHDGDGRRVKKVAGGTTTLYFYDAEGKLLEEYIPATGAGKDYLWMPKSYEPLARVDYELSDADTGDCLRAGKSSPDVVLDWSIFGGSGNFMMRRGTIGDFYFYSNIFGPSSLKTCDDAVLEDTNSYWYDARNRSLTDTLYFYHADHLGTPIAMTDTSSSLVWRAEHTPFGGIYALTVGAITNNLRFPGQYYDSETGLAQNWFRDYDAKIGRYCEPDPVDTKVGCPYNKSYWKFIRMDKPFYAYLYGANNPIKMLDPTAQKEFSCTHYEKRFSETGCQYYSIANKLCGWFKTREPYGHKITTCIGQCLQDFDKTFCKRFNCCGAITLCNQQGHIQCYQACFTTLGALP